jgi:hypothetical protein
VVYDGQHLEWAVLPVIRWTALPRITGHSRAIIDNDGLGSAANLEIASALGCGRGSGQ